MSLRVSGATDSDGVFYCAALQVPGAKDSDGVFYCVNCWDGYSMVGADGNEREANTSKDTRYDSA